MATKFSWFQYMYLNFSQKMFKYDTEENYTLLSGTQALDR